VIVIIVATTFCFIWKNIIFISSDFDSADDDDEPVSSLKQLESHTVMTCIVKCIRLITNDETFISGVHMSANMNMGNKYKVMATQLAHSCSVFNNKMPSQWPPGRWSYTLRILEIVNNVKKRQRKFHFAHVQRKKRWTLCLGNSGKIDNYDSIPIGME
jgi:hypothetical protein